MTRAGSIYLIQLDKKMVPLAKHANDSEALIQALLAYYPDLHAGEKMNQDTPRRWLLIALLCPRLE